MPGTENPEVRDLLAALERHRGFLTFTTLRLTDDEARLTPTASELHIGGLVKHVTATERGWVAFMTGGDMGAAAGDWWYGHHMGADETLEGLLDDYALCAEETEAAVLALHSLDSETPLPEAPWFEPGASWTARRVLLHILAETAQHAGHADIIRETIDGQRTMG
ncbi:MAG TPA: DinB family protein [Propionicimonas sp.]|nr:DinB family protein [Propionicimonas sp.]